MAATNGGEFQLEDVVEGLLRQAGAVVRVEQRVGSRLADFVARWRGQTLAVEVMAGRVFPQRLARIVAMLHDLPKDQSLWLVTERPLTPGLAGWLERHPGTDRRLEAMTVKGLADRLGLDAGSLQSPAVRAALALAEDRPVAELAGPEKAAARQGGALEEAQRRHLARLMSAEAIADLERRGGTLGERLKFGKTVPGVVVLLSDIVNFSTFVKHAPPDLLNETMSSYYRAAKRIVWKHNGTLDKFIGDAVLAIFGYPEPSEDAARDAVRAAEDLVSEGNAIIADLMVNMNDVIDSGTRVGIAKGDIRVMNLSMDDGVEPTFVGDVINRAARCEKNARVNHALIDRLTHNGLRLDDDPQELDGFRYEKTLLRQGDAKGQALDQWVWHVDFKIPPPLADEIAEVRAFNAGQQAPAKPADKPAPAAKAGKPGARPRPGNGKAPPAA